MKRFTVDTADLEGKIINILTIKSMNAWNDILEHFDSASVKKQRKIRIFFIKQLQNEHI